MKAALRQLESELGVGNVRWEAFQNQSSLPAYHRASDALVLRSRDEPWGLVVNEALACGTPCLASDAVGASADLVGDDGAGLVFRAADLSALTAALREACSPGRRGAWKTPIPGLLNRTSSAEDAVAIEGLIASLARGVAGRQRRWGRGATA